MKQTYYIQRKMYGSTGSNNKMMLIIKPLMQPALALNVQRETTKEVFIL